MFFKRKTNLPTWPFLLILFAASALLLLIVFITKTKSGIANHESASITETAPSASQYQEKIASLLNEIIIQDSNPTLGQTLKETRTKILSTNVPGEFKNSHLYIVLTIDKAIKAIDNNDATKLNDIKNDIQLFAKNFNTLN
jgi:hypothetical protein